MKILIQNGHVIDPAAGVDGPAEVAIAAGKILSVGKTPEGFSANRVIDARGLVVAPGLVELAARLREPGNEYKATLDSELRAALQGGVTSVVCLPDTDPVLDEPGLVETLRFRVRSLAQAHVYPLGALTVGLKGDTITEMGQLSEAGCVGFSQAEVAIRDTTVLLRAMQYAHTFGYTVWLRPQDAWLGKGGVAHSGPVAARLGLSGQSSAAEIIALTTLLELVRITGCRVHVCRLSSAKAVDLIRAAKREGLPVTADVSIHHLLLTDVDIGYFDPMARLTPPLRSGRDRDALCMGVVDGTIDAICSDHCPVDDDEKLLPFDEASPGATGLEILLSKSLAWAERVGLGTAAVLARLTQAPAAIAGIRAGSLAVGATADLCLYDPQAWWTIAPRELASQGKNSPFLGHEVQGRVMLTIVNGQLAFERHH